MAEALLRTSMFSRSGYFDLFGSRYSSLMLFLSCETRRASGKIEPGQARLYVPSEVEELKGAMHVPLVEVLAETVTPIYR
jgi:hypothetical protein